MITMDRLSHPLLTIESILVENWLIEMPRLHEGVKQEPTPNDLGSDWSNPQVGVLGDAAALR